MITNIYVITRSIEKTKVKENYLLDYIIKNEPTSEFIEHPDFDNYNWIHNITEENCEDHLFNQKSLDKCISKKVDFVLYQKNGEITAQIKFN